MADKGRLNSPTVESALSNLRNNVDCVLAAYSHALFNQGSQVRVFAVTPTERITLVHAKDGIHDDVRDWYSVLPAAEAAEPFAATVYARLHTYAQTMDVPASQDSTDSGDMSDVQMALLTWEFDQRHSTRNLRDTICVVCDALPRTLFFVRYDLEVPHIQLEALRTDLANLGTAKEQGRGTLRRGCQQALLRLSFPEGSFSQLSMLSATAYEGAPLTGSLVPAPADGTLLVKFETPSRLGDTKAARKLLEMTNSTLALAVAGDGSLVGLCACKGTVVRFTKALQWSLSEDGCVCYVVTSGRVSKPKSRLDAEAVKKKICDVFKDPEGAEAVWSIIELALKQEHGTMVVVSDHAHSEATRLQKQSTKLGTPTVLTGHESLNGLVQAVTAIDGALLVDQHAKCHAIGVILDGTATNNGTPARGARYNSAIRYRDFAAKEGHLCVLLIVSEDGYTEVKATNDCDCPARPAGASAGAGAGAGAGGGGGGGRRPKRPRN